MASARANPDNTVTTAKNYLNSVGVLKNGEEKEGAKSQRRMWVVLLRCHGGMRGIESEYAAMHR